jgi:SpoVK/Ycf46/Vps4 family AAA+-type ATPase
MDKPSPLFYEATPRFRLPGLILNETTRRICDNFIQDQEQTKLLRSYNIEPRNRMLFVGPPGNGKTSLAGAIANELSVPLYVARYDNLNEAAMLLRSFANKRCVLLFDELQIVGKEQEACWFFTRLVDLPSHVVVIVTVRSWGLIDRAALWQFQAWLTLPKPTLDDLIKLFEKFERRAMIPFGYALDDLAKKFIGLNFAEVENFNVDVMRRYTIDNRCDVAKQRHFIEGEIIRKKISQLREKESLTELEQIELNGLVEASLAKPNMKDAVTKVLSGYGLLSTQQESQNGMMFIYP